MKELYRAWVCDRCYRREVITDEISKKGWGVIFYREFTSIRSFKGNADLCDECASEFMNWWNNKKYDRNSIK